MGNPSRRSMAVFRSGGIWLRHSLCPAIARNLPAVARTQNHHPKRNPENRENRCETTPGKPRLTPPQKPQNPCLWTTRKSCDSRRASPCTTNALFQVSTNVTTCTLPGDEPTLSINGAQVPWMEISNAPAAPRKGPRTARAPAAGNRRTSWPLPLHALPQRHPRQIPAQGTGIRTGARRRHRGRVCGKMPPQIGFSTFQPELRCAGSPPEPG